MSCKKSTFQILTNDDIDKGHNDSRGDDETNHQKTQNKLNPFGTTSAS